MKTMKNLMFTRKALAQKKKIATIYFVKNFELNNNHYNNLGNKREFRNYDFLFNMSIQSLGQSSVNYLGLILYLSNLKKKNA